MKHDTHTRDDMTQMIAANSSWSFSLLYFFPPLFSSFTARSEETETWEEVKYKIPPTCILYM